MRIKKISPKKPRKDMSANLGHYLHAAKLPTGGKIGIKKPRKSKTLKPKGY